MRKRELQDRVKELEAELDSQVIRHTGELATERFQYDKKLTQYSEALLELYPDLPTGPVGFYSGDQLDWRGIVYRADQLRRAKRAREDKKALKEWEANHEPV